MTKEELERIKRAYYSGLKIQIWFDGHWENFDIREYSMYPEPFSEYRQYRIVGSAYADIAEQRIAELEKENKRLNVELSNVIEVFQSSSSGDDLEMAECAREIMEILGISCYRHGKVKSRFSEAKEILKELLLAEDENYFCDAEHDMKHFKARKKAKAFINGAEGVK